MGIRNIMGLYMPPVTQSLGIGRETFGLAMAIANIVWGIGAPFAGAISDKYGSGRVIVGGALTTMTGLYLMYAASSGTELLISGLLLGLGISGTGVTTLLGAVGQKVSAEMRMTAMSAVSIGSGIGILCALPYTHLLIEQRRLARQPARPRRHDRHDVAAGLGAVGQAARPGRQRTEATDAAAMPCARPLPCRASGC